jgi:hypothetical protein
VREVTLLQSNKVGVLEPRINKKSTSAELAHPITEQIDTGSRFERIHSFISRG